MTLTDKNKIFFALIHYILVEQKNVDWILKTSLIDFTGISSLLEERPYKTDSILDDVVDMITQIKPYHVQFSHYFEHYQTHTEEVNVNIKDWLDTLIHMRFDALKSTPDLNITFDRYVTSATLPSGAIYNDGGELIFNYDEVGIIIYFENMDRFYIRKINDDDEYVWEALDVPMYEEGFYYCSSTEKIYKYNGSVLKEVKAGSKEALEIIDSHRANRLFYMGLHDSDEIRKELNANFKGLEIVGSTFDIGKFGYDIFNYDTTDYDSPTLIYDYYFLNNLIDDLIIRDGDIEVKTITGAKTEIQNQFEITGVPVTKTFFSTSKERFDIPESWESNSTVKLYKIINGVLTEYLNFEVVIDERNHYIDIFSTMRDREKVYVIKYNGDVPVAAHIAECTIYDESDSKTLRRKIVYIVDNTPTYELNAPETIEGSSDKVAIQKVTYRGTSTPVLNPIIVDNMYVADLINLNPYEHISMVSFDFKYLYDKIYTWEDIYGRSNNVVYLNGNNFYRARYESDRPSELVASTPLNTLFVYNDDGSNNNIFFNDFKNKQLQTKILTTAYKEIEFIEVKEDGTIDSIKLNDVKGLDEAPGKVLINSEIILYNTLDKAANTISDLKRACDGTFLYIDGVSETEEHVTHKIGDKCYPFHDDEWIEINRNNVYKTYNIKYDGEKVFDCPSGIKKSSTVKIKKIKSGKLLEDVKLSNTTIKISIANVVDLDSYNRLQRGQVVEGSWFLQINGDTVPFSTIYSNPEGVGYCIENFTLPEKYIGYGSNVIYSTEDSVISGTLTEFINDFIVQVVESDVSYNLVVENDETYIETESGEKVYRIVGSKINDGEIEELGNIVNIYCTARNDVTNDFYMDEIYFGYIGKDNTFYRNDGSIFGKIENNKFIETLTQVTINEYLNKHDSILINMHNFKYSSSASDNW